jgi:tRNA(fMet)-specific endonuclease VapC
VTKYLIDSDCAIFAMTGQVPMLRAAIEKCEPGDIGISAITLAELALGSELGKPPASGVLQAFLEAIPIVDFNEAAARAYARLPFKRARFDRLLAAHALSLDATIITNNEGDFADVPDLKVENWTRDA